MPESDSTPSAASSSDSPPGALVAVGRILGPHGRDGGVRVKATSDVPGRFDAGNSLSASRDGTVAESRTYQIATSRSVGKDEPIGPAFGDRPPPKSRLKSSHVRLLASLSVL